tara:strand:- start:39 stop:401 length:363 start_codon:yes stop_codon:yes gene_type:complete
MDLTNCKEVIIMEAHKLARRDDAQTSKDAAQKVSLKITKMRQFVLDLINQAGADGITGKEMTRSHLELSTSSISSRPNELEKMGLVFYKGDKRDGSRVIRAIEYKKGEEAPTIEQLELEL